MYSVCSSLLLLVNKVILQLWRAPAGLLFCQCTFTTTAVICLSKLGFVDSICFLTRDNLTIFSIVVVTFTGTLFANAKSLQYANVDAVICLRLTAPLLLSVLEFVCLGRELPARKSMVGLIGIASSFALYLYYDLHSLEKLGMIWLMVWYSGTIFESIYVKYVVMSTTLSTWEQTLYQNLLALPILFLVALANERTEAAKHVPVTIVVLLVFSCFLGFGMSFFSFYLRKELSATTFTMVGNLCKVLTVAANSLVWTQHASPIGVASVILCIGFSSLYSSAPLRPVP